MSELRTIRLYGHLGKRFGRVHHRAITSPHEAIKALCATLPGFREYVQVTHGKSAFRVVVGKEEIGVDQLRDISGGQEISIVPVVRGGKSDFGRVIVGAALIVASYYIPASYAWLGKMAYTVGVANALGGIAGMLAAPPSPYAYDANGGSKNYLFSGAGQSTKAGGCVPVLYGELEIPCVPISTGVRSDYGSSAISHFGTLGDGTGAWSGDGNTTPKGASKSDTAYTAAFIETAMRMYAISEGPCEGLVGGWKGIKLDGTPVLASDGTTWNFTGISAALVNGTQAQPWIPGFPDVETETAAGGEIKHDQPQYITVNDISVGAVRLRITFPALQKIDTGTGKAVSASVQLGVDVQASGGSYVEQRLPEGEGYEGTFLSAGTITDLSSGETSRSITIPLSGTGPWTIRVRRVTADSTDAYTSDKSYLGSYATITYAKLRHPWTAKLALAFNAKQFSSMPEVTLRYRGRIIKVPSNYDPIARTYTGAWDGTFKDAWSNNPAWCYLDMATHPRYGSGRYVSQSSIDIWGLYEIAQYCDEKVSDGTVGGTEPRFRFDCYLSSPEEAFKVLAHMMSVARAALYYGGSLDSPSTSLTAVQDRDETAVSLFSPSNVIGGKFTYTGTPRKTRYTEVTVWWNDPEQGYKLVPVLVVADSSYISRYGVQSTSTVAFGCTSKAQAIREGRRILLTNLLETETVTFSSGLEGMVAFPGARVLIKDPRRDGANQAGRTIDGCTTTTLALDRPVTMASGTAYTAYVTLPDGTVQSRAITTAAGTVSSVTLASALSSAPQAESQWQITPTATAPTRWRILTVKENKGEDAISYEIAAVQSAPEKYALIDDVGTVLSTPTDIPTAFAPVTNLVATSNTAWADGKPVITLLASWTVPSGASGCLALYQHDNGQWQNMTLSGSTATATLPAVGPCHVKVFATYANGISAPAIASITVPGVAATTPASLTESVRDAVPVGDDIVIGSANYTPREAKAKITATAYVTLNWTHTEPNPSAHKGFRAVIYTGSDPNNLTYRIAEKETSPQRRSVVFALDGLYSDVKAAVQAIYLDGNESSWRLSDGSVVVDPDTVELGTAADVAAATAAVATINSDDALSRAKKPQAITDYNAEITTRAQLQAAAMACSPAVDHSAYTSAVDTLASFLGGLTPTWTDLTQDTPLGSGGGATLRSRWATIAQQRAALQVSIGQAQATKASNDAISAAAQDAATQVSNALTQAANDATEKAAAQKQAAIDSINSSVAGMVSGATSAADAVGKIQTLASNAASMARTANLVKNGNSEEANPTGYEAAGVVSDKCYSGTKSRRIVLSKAGDVGSLDLASFPVLPGEWYTADAYAYASVGTNVSLDIVFYNASGVKTGSGSPWDSRIQSLPGWGALSTFTSQAPADAVRAVIQFQAQGNSANAPAWLDNIYVERKSKAAMDAQAAAQTAQSAANAAQTMPTYASPAELPAASSFTPGYGPVLTLSDYSLWKVNSGATAWDRILFGAEGIFGKVTIDHLDVTDDLRAAVVDATHVNATLLTLMDAKVTNGKTVIGPGSMDIDAIRARTITLVGDNLVPNPNSTLPIPAGGWPSGWLEGAALASDTPTGQQGSRKLTCSGVGASTCATVASIPCAPGDSFYAAAMVYANTYVEVAVEVDYFNAAGTMVGTDGTGWDAAPWAAPAWLLSRNGSGAAPAGTVSAQVRLCARAVTGANGYSAWFGSLVCRRMDAGELTVDGSVLTRKLSATAASTTNFTQAADDVNGGVYAAAGACMMVNTASTPALITDAAGLKIGKRVFTDYWFRLFNGIDGSRGSGLVLWRGNNDPTVLGGAPVIASNDANPATSPRLLINTTRVFGDCTSLRFQAQPVTNADNLDALSHVEVIVWMQNGEFMSQEGTVGYPAISSRRYAVPGTPTSASNAGNGAWTVLSRAGLAGLTSATYPMILQCRLCNVYGDSAQHYYLPPAASGNGSTSATGRWTDVGTSAPYSGGTGGGGAGGGGTIGGGGCPAPWVRITLASGLTIDAGSLIDGMQVVGVDEQTMEPAVGIVREPHMRWVERVRVVLEDGRAPEFTDSHRVALASGGWAEVCNLKPGDLLVAQRESRVRAVTPTGKGQVISFTVEGCHTYFSDDILSHNIKTRDV